MVLGSGRGGVFDSCRLCATPQLLFELLLPLLDDELCCCCCRCWTTRTCRPPCHEDILLAKLRPGQSIEFEAHARVGVGKDHAKYSPVATACYRLMPRVRLLKPVYNNLADEIDIYEPGVFRIVPCTDPDDLAAGHTKKAVVDNPYACTMSRNLMRNPVLRESVEITRVPDHFIFSVESVGALPAAVVLAESVKILKAKCENLVRMVDDHEDNGKNGVAA